MNMTFEGAWADIRQRLKPSTIIKNWSIQGYTGGEFRTDGVDAAAIAVIPENGKPRSISKGERPVFELLGERAAKAFLSGRAR